MQARSYQDNMDASAEQVVSNRESVRQAKKCEIAKKRYEVGKGTILELNDSEVAQPNLNSLAISQFMII